MTHQRGSLLPPQSTSYCFYSVWWGGAGCGPRFTTDIFPIVCLLIGYYIELLRHSRNQGKNYGLKLLGLNVAIIFSTFTQFVSVSSYVNSGWFSIPYNAEMHQNIDRLWQWRDSQIERAAKYTLHKSIPLIAPKIDSGDIAKSAGLIQKLMDRNNLPLASPILGKPASMTILKLQVFNSGHTRWYGYQEALVEKGETKIRGVFYDRNNKVISENRFFIVGSPLPQESTEAIGEIIFPKEPGNYHLVLSFILEGLGEFPASNSPSYSLSIVVK